MIKMDHIGSVADILGPDPYMQEDSITMDELPGSSVGEERDEVDGQTILSFASAEEMQEYVARKESGSRLMKTNDLKQIKGWKNKFNQLTPSLSPSPCSSPTTPIPLQSEIPASNVSESPPPTVSSESCDVPCMSLDTEEKELTNLEEISTKEEVTCREEIKKEILSVTAQEEQAVPLVEEHAEPVVDSNKTEPELGPDNIITAEFAKYAVSAVSIPSLERTRQAAKKLDVIPKESKEVPSRPTSSASRKQRKSEKVPVEVPASQKVDVDEIQLPLFNDSVEDIVVHEEEYQQEYGKLIINFSLQFYLTICIF